MTNLLIGACFLPVFVFCVWASVYEIRRQARLRARESARRGPS